MAKANWGAGLRALGQGLAGLAEQQRMEQERAMLRQQGLDDQNAVWKRMDERDAANRKYDEELWNKRNPMVDLPSQTIDVPVLSIPGVPGGPQEAANPQRQPWMGSLSQMPQDTYTQLSGQFAMDQMNAGQQDERDRATFENQAARDAYDRETRLMIERMQVDRAAAGKSPGITALESMLNSQVSDQEVKLRGSGYRAAVKDRFYELASPADQGGGGLGYNQATLNQAENEVLQSGQFGSLNFPGIVPGEEAANSVKYNPDTGEFYDSRYYQPDSGERGGKGPDWLHKDTTPSSAMLGGLPRSLEDEATRAAPMSRGTYARQFILPYLKKGQPGYLDGDKAPELLAWAQKNGIDAETLAAIIREAQNTPNDPPAPGKYVPGSDLFPASADVDAILGGGL